MSLGIINWVSFRAISNYKNMAVIKKRLTDLLIEGKYITKEQLDKSLEIQSIRIILPIWHGILNILQCLRESDKAWNIY